MAMQFDTSTDARALILDRLARLAAMPPGRVHIGVLGPSPVAGGMSNMASRLNTVVAGRKRVALPLAEGAGELTLETGDGHFSVANSWELQHWDTEHELLCIVPRAEYLRVSLYLVTPPVPRTCIYFHTNRPHAPAFTHVLRALEALALQPHRTLPAGLLATYVELTREAVAMPPRKVMDRGAQRCADIRRYIDNVFQEGLTRDDVARYFGLSSGHLSLLFKETYGVGVGAYILDCRMQLALSLLRQTDLAVYQIAAQCGFGSAVHFVRAFRQRHGVPPGKWRGGA